MTSRESQLAKHLKSSAWSPTRTDRLGLRSAWAGQRHIAPPGFQTPPRRFTISDPIASSSGLYLLVVRTMGVSRKWAARRRSEEHTSELQSLMRISYAVFCLKKKKSRKKIEDIVRVMKYLRIHNTWYKR